MITMQTFIIAVFSIAVVMLIAQIWLRQGKSTKDVEPKKEEAMNKLNLSDEQILKLSVDDLCKMSNDELKKLVDYAGHRIVELPEEEKHHWRKMFELASAALYGYL